MKILHLCSEYPPQRVFGLGRFVRDLAEEQARQGHRVTVITNSLGGDCAETNQSGVRVLRVDYPPPPKPATNTGCILVFNLLCIKRALKLGADTLSKLDVICSHDWLTAPAAQALHIAFGPPHISTFHDTTHGKRLGQIFAADDQFGVAAERWAVQTASHVIANSAATKIELMEVYGGIESKITVVPCAISPATFPALQDPIRAAAFRETFAAQDEFLILYVGRLDPEKGVEVLLAAFEEAQIREARLFLAGTGQLREELEATVRHHYGLRDQIHFLGYVENPALANLYRSADVLVCPSRYEPFGMVALEGMLQGTAVILSKTGGLAELIQAGREGQYVEPGDILGLARTLRQCASHRAELKSQGAAGRERVLARHTWPNACKATTEIYRNCSRRSKTLKARSSTPIFVGANLHDANGYSVGKKARGCAVQIATREPETLWVTTGPDDLLPISTFHRQDSWILASLNLGAKLLSRSRIRPSKLICHHWHGCLAATVLRGFDSKLPIEFIASDGRAVGNSEDHTQAFDSEMEAWIRKEATRILTGPSLALDGAARPTESSESGAEINGRGEVAILGDPQFFRDHLALGQEFLIVTALRLESPFSAELYLEFVQRIQENKFPVRWILCGEGPLRAFLQRRVEQHQLPVRLLGYTTPRVLESIFAVSNGALVPFSKPASTYFIEEGLSAKLPVFVCRGTQHLQEAADTNLHELDFDCPAAAANAFIQILSAPVAAAHPVETTTQISGESEAAQEISTSCEEGPQELVLFNNWGIGDELMLSAVAREIKRAYPQKRIWIRSRHSFLYPEFCESDPIPDAVEMVETIYQNASLYGPQHHSPYPGHLVQQMLDKVALDTGLRVEAQNLRPELKLPIKQVSRHSSTVLLHCRPNGRFPSKDWGLERWQELTETLHHNGYQVIQVGLRGDPLLPHVKDRRDIPLPELPELFLRTGLVVCLVGMLMHMAAATRTPAIVIYGGREHPAIDGYPDHVHLASDPLSCRGRWGCHLDPDVECPHGMKCMNTLSPKLVLQIVKKILPIPLGVTA